MMEKSNSAPTVAVPGRRTRIGDRSRRGQADWIDRRSFDRDGVEPIVYDLRHLWTHRHGVVDILEGVREVAEFVALVDIGERDLHVTVSPEDPAANERVRSDEPDSRSKYS